jgi:hypothetical protein
LEQAAFDNKDAIEAEAMKIMETQGVEAASRFLNDYSNSIAMSAFDKSGVLLNQLNNQLSLVSVRTADRSDPAGKIEYFVSIREAVNVLSLELEFEVDSAVIAGAGCTGLNGFDAMDVVWTKLSGDMYKGKVTLRYPAGLSSDGFSSKSSADILKLMFDARAFGEAALKITGFKVTGLDAASGKVVYYHVVIETASGTTFIYSKFDLNRDTVVDLLDLGIIQLYFGAVKGESSWNAVRTTDSYGKPVLASYCDFNGDGAVDIVDIMLLYANFT